MAVITVTVVLLGGALFLTCERILLAVGNFLVVKDKLQPSDVIHVISGPDHRTDYGIKLYQQGYGRQIFFTGGWCPLYNENHGRRAKELAFDQGMPLEAIAIDDSKVTSTYAEVVKLKEFIAQSQVPIRSVIVVSDPHHMRRARWTYREVLGDEVWLQMAPVPFKMSPHQRRWWTDEVSRKMVRNEYLKILYYCARYRLSWGLLTEWLAALEKN